MPIVKTIAVLLLRLWAANTVIYTVTSIITFASMDLTQTSYGSAQTDQLYRISSYVVGPIWLLLGFCAWVFARPIAALMAPTSAEPATTESPSLDTEALVTIGSFLIGIYILVVRLPGAVLRVIESGKELLNPLNQTHIYETSRLVESLIVIAIALFLTFRPRDLARMFAFLGGRT